MIGQDRIGNDDGIRFEWDWMIGKEKTGWDQIRKNKIRSEWIGLQDRRGLDRVGYYEQDEMYRLIRWINMRNDG